MRKKAIDIKKLIYLIAIILFPSFSYGQADDNRFISGEKLEFIIYYGILNGGVVNTELKLVEYDGQLVYHSKLLAKSTGLADKLYLVRDEYQSYFDPETILPVKSIRDIQEGRYTKYNIVYYNHAEKHVTNIDRDTFEVPSDIRDMVAVFHYIRNVDYVNLREGSLIKINTFFDNEIFPFDMRYIGKEEIKTKMGTYSCIKLVPYVEPGRIFKSEDDMTIWLSDDRNRVPVRVKFNLTVGSIKCDLINYSGLKY